MSLPLEMEPLWLGNLSFQIVHNRAPIEGGRDRTVNSYRTAITLSLGDSTRDPRTLEQSSCVAGQIAQKVTFQCHPAGECRARVTPRASDL
jgi:hypothetical protein